MPPVAKLTPASVRRPGRKTFFRSLPCGLPQLEERSVVGRMSRRPANRQAPFGAVNTSIKISRCRPRRHGVPPCALVVRLVSHNSVMAQAFPGHLGAFTIDFVNSE